MQSRKLVSISRKALIVFSTLLVLLLLVGYTVQILTVDSNSPTINSFNYFFTITSFILVISIAFAASPSIAYTVITLLIAFMPNSSVMQFFDKYRARVTTSFTVISWLVYVILLTLILPVAIREGFFT